MSTIIERLNETADFFRRWPLYIADPESCVVNNPAILLEARDEIERLRAALDDMIDLAEMLSGSLGQRTYRLRFEAARKALKGEPNERNAK